MCFSAFCWVGSLVLHHQFGYCFCALRKNRLSGFKRMEILFVKGLRLEEFMVKLEIKEFLIFLSFFWEVMFQIYIQERHIASLWLKE